MLPCLAALGRPGKTQFGIMHSRRGRHFAFPQRVKFLDTFKEGVRRPLALRNIIPCEKLTSLIFMLVRACVHYALFEDEFYLKTRWRKAKYPAACTSGRYAVNAYVCRNCRSTSAS